MKPPGQGGKGYHKIVCRWMKPPLFVSNLDHNRFCDILCGDKICYTINRGNFL
jgi:hypothetical protein